jgi:hypothetical protein
MSEQSPSFNEVPNTGAAASATTNAPSPSASASGDGFLVNARLTVGVNGPSLTIVNGGVRLPDDTVRVNE